MAASNSWQVSSNELKIALEKIITIQGFSVENTDNFNLEENCAEGIKKLPDFLISMKDLAEVNLRVQYEFENYKNGEGPDLFKQAGYICFWIRKLKPIRVIRQNDELPEIRGINEKCAIWIGINLLYKSYGKFDFPRDFLDEFIYTLRFRAVSPQSVGLIFWVLFESYQWKISEESDN